MNYGKFQKVIDYAQSNLSVDDFAHTSRVFNYALQILESEKDANAEVVLLSALLHDINRMGGKSKNNEKAKKIHDYLIEEGYAEELAAQVAECVTTHSKDSETEPQTLEAKILYDADKLDMTGAVGAVRIIAKCVHEKIPLYVSGEDYLPMKGKKDEPSSVIKKYNRELKKAGTLFFTKKAKKIADKQQKTAKGFANNLVKEIDRNYKAGIKLTAKYCEE
jgi:uncharacterized protein